MAGGALDVAQARCGRRVRAAVGRASRAAITAAPAARYNET